MPQTTGEERREFQRLRLHPPLSATFADHEVGLLEVGVLGARMRHPPSLDAARGELRFLWSGDDIAMRCEIVRTVGPDRAKYPGNGCESGIRFVAALGHSGDRLRDMLAEIVMRELAERHDATASATRLHIRSIDGDKTVRGVDAQFLSYRLENGAWQRRPIFLPEQPAVGFTVARGEDTDELRRLCEVYEASDEEGRRLIRLFAELSVSQVLQIPPRT
jgi:hypothetical protein